jgi:hypothetical protein
MDLVIHLGLFGMQSVMKPYHETLNPLPSMASTRSLHVQARSTDTSLVERPIRGTPIWFEDAAQQQAAELV